MPNGNPEATEEATLKIVMLKIHRFVLSLVKQVYAECVARWEKLSELSEAIHG